jgi:hypothetical protein
MEPCERCGKADQVLLLVSPNRLAGPPVCLRCDVIRDPLEFLALPQEAMYQVLAKQPELVHERFMLSRGLRIKSQLLHYAAEDGNRGAIEVLLSAGADVNSVTDAGMSPLHFAAAYGKADACRALLELGASYSAVVRAEVFRTTDTRGCPWFTPLHVAIETMCRVPEDTFPDYLAVARALIEAGTPLYAPFPSTNAGSILQFIRETEGQMLESRRAACIELFPKPPCPLTGTEIEFVWKQRGSYRRTPAMLTVTVDLATSRNVMKPIPHRRYDVSSIRPDEKQSLPGIVPVVLAPDGHPYGMVIRVKDGKADRHFVDVAAMRHGEVMTVETSLNPWAAEQYQYTWFIKGIS